MDEFDPGNEEIMEATFRALGEQGHRNLTIQDIADEFDKSKSLLYYHYDSKEMLFADLFRYISQKFLEELQLTEGSPKAQLHHLIDRLLPGTIDEERYAAQVALLELRSQIPHVDVYAEQYTEIDSLFKRTVSDIIRTGIEQGQFHEVDPEQEANLLVSAVSGMRTRRLTSADFSVEAARQTLFAHLHTRLFKETASYE